MALIDFSALILDLFGEMMKDGTPPKEGEPDTRRPLTLAAVAVTALTNQTTDELGMSVETKLQRFKLAVAVAKGGPVDLKAEDIAIVKAGIGKMFTPLAVGRAFELLDPPAPDPLAD